MGRIPGGKVSVKTSCRKRAKDHHLNVRIALKSSKGVKGSCAVKVSKSKVLTWKHVANKARRCGVSKKLLSKVFRRCRKRGRGFGCLLDFVNPRCRAARKVKAIRRAIRRHLRALRGLRGRKQCKSKRCRAARRRRAIRRHLHLRLWRRRRRALRRR